MSCFVEVSITIKHTTINHKITLTILSILRFKHVALLCDFNDLAIQLSNLPLEIGIRGHRLQLCDQIVLLSDQIAFGVQILLQTAIRLGQVIDLMLQGCDL